MIKHLDACAQALLAQGVPCTEYQMWVDDADLVHYWFGYGRPLTDRENARVAEIMYRYFYEEV